jgi:hypothetical protein
MLKSTSTNTKGFISSRAYIKNKQSSTTLQQWTSILTMVLNLLVYSTQRTLSLSHWLITCSRHDMAENCSFGVKQQSFTHSLIQWKLYNSLTVTVLAFFLSSTSACFRSPLYSLMVRVWWRSSKCQLSVIWLSGFDQTEAWTHCQQHSRQTR